MSAKFHNAPMFCGEFLWTAKVANAFKTGSSLYLNVDSKQISTLQIDAPTSLNLRRVIHLNLALACFGLSHLTMNAVLSQRGT